MLLLMMASDSPALPGTPMSAVVIVVQADDVVVRV